MAKRLNTLSSRTERLSPHRQALPQAAIRWFPGGGRHGAQDYRHVRQTDLWRARRPAGAAFDLGQSARIALPAAAASGVTHLHDPHDRSGGAHQTGHRLRRPATKALPPTWAARYNSGEGRPGSLGPGSGYRPRPTPHGICWPAVVRLPAVATRLEALPTTRRRRCSSRSPPAGSLDLTAPGRRDDHLAAPGRRSQRGGDDPVAPTHRWWRRSEAAPWARR